MNTAENSLHKKWTNKMKIQTQDLELILPKIQNAINTIKGIEAASDKERQDTEKRLNHMKEKMIRQLQR